MIHARTQIRSAVVALLTANAALPRKIASGKQYPVQPEDLPALLVYTREEVSQEDRSVMGGPPILDHRLELLIVGVINVEDSDDLADALALEVDNAIGDAAADGGALDAMHVELDLSTIATTISAATETQRGIRVIEIRYPLSYRTLLGAADIIVN
jgi:hypothetical protein